MLSRSNHAGSSFHLDLQITHLIADQKSSSTPFHQIFPRIGNHCEHTSGSLQSSLENALQTHCEHPRKPIARIYGNTSRGLEQHVADPPNHVMEIPEKYLQVSFNMLWVPPIYCEYPQTRCGHPQRSAGSPKPLLVVKITVIEGAKNQYFPVPPGRVLGTRTIVKLIFQADV